MKRRPLRAAALLGVVLVFVGLSAGLARILAANGAERTAVTDLIRAEARGDAAMMLRRLEGCSARPACRERVRANVTRLRRPGSVEVLRLDLSSRFAWGAHRGVARIAWRTLASRLPVVQCVGVRRGGNPVAGLTVALYSISPRLAAEAHC